MSGGNQELQLWLAQQLKPSLNFRFDECIVDNKRVVVLTIPSASLTSTKFKHIAYLRIGSATPKLDEYPEREAALTAALRPFVWEKGVAETNISEADVLQAIDVEGYFSLLGQKRPESTIDIINKLLLERVIERSSRNGFDVTNLGAVLFARQISAFEGVKRKSIRVIQYDGRARTRTIKELEGSKGYATGFHGLIKYLMEILPQKERIEGGFRRSYSEYRDEMIREAVANALIHQDFAITGAGPMIEIFRDRIEITNSGHPLIEPSRFIDMPPRSRNEQLAGMMRRINICEERGSGVDKIIEGAEANVLPAPDFKVEGHNSKTIIYAPRLFRETSPTERIRACYQHSVMRYMGGDRMTNSSLRLRLGIDDRNAAQVSRILNEAMEQRHIKQSDSWSTRSGTYVPIWA